MESNIMNYLQLFFCRKYFFLYPFLGAVFLAVVLSFIMPKTYVSTAVILMDEQNVINPLISGLAVSTAVGDRLRILREQILSWKSLAELTKRLKLDSNVKSQFSYEELIKELRKNIIVELRGPQLVMISYQGSVPDDVQKVAKELTDIFIQQNLQSKTGETDVAVNFLEGQLKFYRNKIKEGEIKRVQEELDNLRVDSTENHPLVKSLKARIAKLQEELKDTDSQIKIQAQPLVSNRDMLSYLILKEVQKQENPLAGTQSVVTDLTVASDEAADFTRRAAEGLPLDTTINQNIYTMLMQRLETAHITKQLENFKEGSGFTIIDPPRLPLKPIKPDPIKFLLMGIVLGAAVGYGCVYCAEIVDKSYKNFSEAKAELGLPVLGAISRIITEDEYAKRALEAKVSYVLMAVFFALMVISVLMISVVK